MKEIKKVYGHFQLLKKNGENSISKVVYSSLDKYSKSPYLQKINIQSTRRQQARQNTPSHHLPSQPPPQSPLPHAEDKVKLPLELPKLTTPLRLKQEASLKAELEENSLVKDSKACLGTHSATLEVPSKPPLDSSSKVILEASKTGKLQPLHLNSKVSYSMKTKAGTTGKHSKTNQDMAIIDVKLPFGIQLFGVCDGHGVNGHLVSFFIKIHLLKSLNISLKTLTSPPSHEQLKMEVHKALANTNKELLQSEINTELSGSTVVVVVLYVDKVLCFNVGDSRAILLRQEVLPEKEGKQGESQGSSELSFIDFKFNSKPARHQWKVIPLTSDHKPDRPDERQRIIDFGGRIFSQKNERGENLGPLRVWMKELLMPGLAMTRSFGDKAGMKAGTNGQPEISEFELSAQDKFIVIASDGIWEYLENDQVMTLMIPFYQRLELELAAERLVKVATEIWQKVSFSRDDITVVLVALNSK